MAAIDLSANIIDMNSPGLDPAQFNRDTPDTRVPYLQGYNVTGQTVHTITADAAPWGYIGISGAACTVQVPTFKEVPFRPGMTIGMSMDTPTGVLTLVGKPGVRLIPDTNVALPLVRSGAGNGFHIRNLGRDLWLVMRGMTTKAAYDLQPARMAANEAAGLPFWWPQP